MHTTIRAVSRFAEELRGLFRLALPIAAAQTGTQLMSVVDTAVVGRVGAVPLAAIGLGNSIFFAVSIVGMGAVMGIDPLASQAVGAQQPERARALLWQGMWLSLFVTIALAAVGAIVPLGMTHIDLPPDVVRLGSIFLWIRLLSLFPTLAFIVVRAYLQALHITRPMVMAMIAGNIFNFIADVLFVFGGHSLPAWCGPLRLVPAMGIAGAAVATVLGSFLQLWIIAAAVQHVPCDAAPERIRALRMDDVRHALRVGLPVGLQMGAEYGIFALVGVLAGRFGALQLAAHQTALTLISFTFTLAVGIGSAGSVRVGRAVGSRDIPGARMAGLAAFCGGMCVMLCSAAVFLSAPGALARVITSDPAVVAAAVPLLAVAAVFQLSDGIQGVGAGVLRGAGDTHYSFVANIIGHWCVGFPIALWLGFHRGGGVVGLWWGLCGGLSAVALLLFFRFLLVSSRDIKPLHDVVI